MRVFEVYGNSNVSVGLLEYDMTTEDESLKCEEKQPVINSVQGRGEPNIQVVQYIVVLL